MDYLNSEINRQIERIKKDKNKELLEIFYLFYDDYDYNFK
jgi:hypothetical protein